MVERWEGILRACCCGASNPTRVMASLIVCPTTGTLMTPSSNAVLFMGDCVRGTGNAIIERFSRLDNIAKILVSKLGDSVNAWVVEASRFQGPFACYEEFLPSLSSHGEPLCYVPEGLPAAGALTSLLNNCLVQVNKELLHVERKGLYDHRYRREIQGDHIEQSEAPICSLPRTLLFGFSKGGVVLNQFLAEISHVERHGLTVPEDSQKPQESTTSLHSVGVLQYKFQQIHRKLPKSLQFRSVNRSDFNGCSSLTHEHEPSRNGNKVLPATIDEFLKSIAGIHYVDVGLNCPGAYQTHESVLENVVKAAMSSTAGLHLAFHGTPRQWNDKTRHWICSEKDHCIQTLRRTAKNLGTDKIWITENFYFEKDQPSLQMHFQILESLILD